MREMTTEIKQPMWQFKVKIVEREIKTDKGNKIHIL